MPIETKIFMGIAISKELHLHLDRSELWKEDQLIKGSILSECKIEDKKYIGLFFSNGIGYLHLKTEEIRLKKQLQIYCPKINLDPYHCVVFSQLFIS